MRLLSVNVGLPRDVRWRDRTVMTAIFKSPVSGRCRVGAAEARTLLSRLRAARSQFATADRSRTTVKVWTTTQPAGSTSTPS